MGLLNNGEVMSFINDTNNMNEEMLLIFLLFIKIF